MTAEDFPELPENSTRAGALLRKLLPLLLSLLPLLYSLQYLRTSVVTLDAYGTTHYFLTYHYGFLRRALAGEALARLGFLSARFLLYFELSVFLLTVLVTYLFFRKQIFGNWNERLLFACLLGAPALIPQFASLEGHIDALLFIGLLCACYVLCRWPGWTGLLLSTGISLAAMLQHEAYLLMFYPAVFLLALTQVVRGRLRLLPVLACGAVLAAGFVLILHEGNLKVPAEIAWNDALARTDAMLDRGVIEVINRGFKGQLADTLGVYRRASTVPSFVLSLLLAAPYFALLMLLFQAALTAMNERWGALRKLILPALLTPLILIIAGDDLMRWVSSVCIDTTLVLLFWYRFSAPDSALRRSLQQIAGRPWFAAIFLYLLAIGPFDVQHVRIGRILTELLLSLK